MKGLELNIQERQNHRPTVFVGFTDLLLVRNLGVRNQGLPASSFTGCFPPSISDVSVTGSANAHASDTEALGIDFECTGPGNVNLGVSVQYEAKRAIVIEDRRTGIEAVAAASVAGVAETLATAFLLKANFGLVQDGCLVQSVLVTQGKRPRTFNRGDAVLTYCAMAGERMSFAAQTSDRRNVEWDLGGLASDPGRETESFPSARGERGRTSPDTFVTEPIATPGRYVVRAFCDDDRDNINNPPSDLRNRRDYMEIVTIVSRVEFVTTRGVVTHLDIARWDDLQAQGNLRNEADPTNNFIDQDPRRFWIRAFSPALNASDETVQIVRAILQTTGTAPRERGGIEGNPPVEIAMRETGPATGVFQSPTLLLVSNVADDAFQAHNGTTGVVQDNSPGDRTFIAVVGQTVRAELIVSEAGPGGHCPAEARVCRPADAPEDPMTDSFSQRTVAVRFVVMNMGPLATLTGAQRDAGVNLMLRRMNESWAQACVRLEPAEVVTANPVQNIMLITGLNLDAFTVTFSVGDRELTGRIQGGSAIRIAEELAALINRASTRTTQFQANAFNVNPQVEFAGVVVNRGTDVRITPPRDSAGVRFRLPRIDFADTLLGPDEQIALGVNYKDIGAGSEASLDAIIVDRIDNVREGVTFTRASTNNGVLTNTACFAEEGVRFAGGAGTPQLPGHEVGHAILNDASDLDHHPSAFNLMFARQSADDFPEGPKRLTPDQIHRIRQQPTHLVQQR